MKTVSGALRSGLLGPLCLLAVLLFASNQSASHEITPTVADFQVKNGDLFIELHFNAEAFVAGMDLDNLSDTAEADESANYSKLRSLVSSELEPLVREFAIPWMDKLDVQAQGRVKLSYEGVNIPVVGNQEVARTSTLLLTGNIPENAHNLQVSWPVGAGSLVLRQQGVEAPYTGFLQGGETSPAIPLVGGSALGSTETMETFFSLGFSRILPNGPEQIAFVLAMLFLSVRARPLILQLIPFSLGFSTMLALGTLAIVAVPQAVVALLVPAGIVLLAVENIFARRLHLWRMIAVFGFGLLHGSDAASDLIKSAIPPNHAMSAIIGYGVGAGLAILAVGIAGFAVTTLFSFGSQRFRSRIRIPASMVIALIGAYWCITPFLAV